jgi:hypothetical protein
VDAFFVDAELVVGQSEAVMFSLPAELRIARPAGEEILERASQLDDRHLRRVLGHLEHPRKLFALDGVELATQCQL